MISADVSKVLEELKAYHADTIRRMENMVRGFAYTISQTAIENTPIGDAEQYIKLYELRQGRTGLEPVEGFARGSLQVNTTGLEPVEGFARGSWQVNTTGQFSMQAIYGVNSGSEALSLVKADLGSYKLGDTVFVGNKGFYIRLLENNYSSQTNKLGIMQPTLESIMQTYKVDLPRLFREG